MADRKKSVIDLGERGKYNTKNKLNELTGKEWIKFTKSWFIHRPARRNGSEILHPAKFPESLVEEFIAFFTKENAWVLDPAVGCRSWDRNRPCSFPAAARTVRPVPASCSPVAGQRPSRRASFRCP